ncbi:chromate efflux transporter [Maritimibacter sp. HL-12]|uniref:chromate efflux transporter n=1 Tax=Maritimibacter sp. HL-12 TaxID=1162418 RepID=UPI000A0EF5D2|nr:chromate efflux transporter [Maritimibacter sp. HL-12]SMH58258.1 chromate transporter [Maritimibacter sp. HL-12]
MRPALSALVITFGRIGLMSFGGPVAQIGVMQRELVETRSWLTEAEFLKGLSFAMLLPGPEAMQLGTYAGWRLRGITGGLIAGTLFILPGALVMAAVAWAYGRWGAMPALAPAFLGIKAVVIVVLVQALWRLGSRALRRPLHHGLALAALVAIAVAGWPFPLVVALAALAGLAGGRGAGATSPAPRPGLRAPLAAGGGFLVLWLAPLAALWAAGTERLLDVGLFFSRLAVVSFGGAYAALAYTAQAAVEAEGWLTAAQMVDGLGLAESTPGPLILVTQFVGYLAGHAAGGAPLGFAAAAVTLWAVFLPSFVLVFSLAPFLERLTAQPRITAAMEGVSAAVVGVIAALGLYFATHVLFAEVAPSGLPAPASLSPVALGLVAFAAVLLVRFRLSLPIALTATAGAGALTGLIG